MIAYNQYKNSSDISHCILRLQNPMCILYSDLSQIYTSHISSARTWLVATLSHNKGLDCPKLMVL